MIFITGIPRPPGFFRATGTVDSTAIQDGQVGKVDISTTLIHDHTAKTDPVVTDALLLADSQDSNVNKKVTLANLVELLSAIGSRLVDDPGTLFYEAAEIDFGGTGAVDTKITDAASAKGKLVSVQAVVTEAFNGDTDSTIVISSAGTGATPMCSNIVIDKDAGANGNWVGAAFGALPNSDNSEIVASGGDVYAYRAGVANCSAGKVYFVLTFMKTA